MRPIGRMMDDYVQKKIKGDEMARKVTIEKIGEILQSLQNKKLTDKLINEIISQLSQSNVHQKTIEKDGKLYVWCNYHNQYEPAEMFTTKSNGKYKSNCKEADKILRKFRALKRKINDVNLKLYRHGLMNPDLENEIMSKLTLDIAQEFDFDIIPIIDAIYPNDIKQKAIEIIGSQI